VDEDIGESWISSLDSRRGGFPLFFIFPFPFPHARARELRTRKIEMTDRHDKETPEKIQVIESSPSLFPPPLFLFLSFFRPARRCDHGGRARSIANDIGGGVKKRRTGPFFLLLSSFSPFAPPPPFVNPDCRSELASRVIAQAQAGMQLIENRFLFPPSFPPPSVRFRARRKIVSFSLFFSSYGVFPPLPLVLRALFTR